MSRHQIYQKFSGENGIAPIGQNPLPGQNLARFQDDLFDRLLSQLRSADPSEASSKALYDQILNEFFKQQPLIMINQAVDPTSNNTAWWSGWPTNKDLYISPTTGGASSCS